MNFFSGNLDPEQDQARLDYLLKKQAQDMGLSHFDPSREVEVIQNRKNAATANERESLKGFAGLRGPEFDLPKSMQNVSNEPDVKEYSCNDQPVFADIELSLFSSSAELQVFGLEHLKHELARQGLKCGGTLQERCDRLWMTKGVVDWSELPANILAKPLAAILACDSIGPAKASSMKRANPAVPGITAGQKRKKPDSQSSSPASTLASYLGAASERQDRARAEAKILADQRNSQIVTPSEKRSAQGPLLPGQLMVPGQKRLPTLIGFKQQLQGPRARKEPKLPRGDNLGPLL